MSVDKYMYNTRLWNFTSNAQGYNYISLFFLSKRQMLDTEIVIIHLGQRFERLTKYPFDQATPSANLWNNERFGEISFAVVSY